MKLLRAGTPAERSSTCLKGDFEPRIFEQDGALFRCVRTLTMNQAMMLAGGFGPSPARAQPDVIETTSVAPGALTTVSHVEAGRLGLVLVPAAGCLLDPW